MLATRPLMELTRPSTSMRLCPLYVVLPTVANDLLASALTMTGPGHLRMLTDALHPPTAWLPATSFRTISL